MCGSTRCLSIGAWKRIFCSSHTICPHTSGPEDTFMYIYNLARFDFKVSLQNITYFRITFYFINIKLSRIARNPPSLFLIMRSASTTISNCTKPRPLSLISVAAHPPRLFYSNLFIKKRIIFVLHFKKSKIKWMSWNQRLNNLISCMSFQFYLKNTMVPPSYMMNIDINNRIWQWHPSHSFNNKKQKRIDVL